MSLFLVTLGRRFIFTRLAYQDKYSLSLEGMIYDLFRFENRVVRSVSYFLVGPGIPAHDKI